MTFLNRTAFHFASIAVLRKCVETIYGVSMPGWHVPEFAKGVAHKPRPSQTLGRATRKAVSNNFTLPKAHGLTSDPVNGYLKCLRR